MTVLYEYANGTGGGAPNLWGNNWGAQTFTVGTVGSNVPFEVDYVKLYVYRDTLTQTGNYIVGIKETDNFGKPSGNYLCSGDFVYNDLTTSPTVTQFNMTSGAILSPSTKYSVILSWQSGADADHAVKHIQSTPDVYAGGNRTISSDGGNTWVDQSNDMWFEVYGTLAFRGQINIGDSWKQIVTAKINIGDVWKTVVGMQINIGDTWKTIF